MSAFKALAAVASENLSPGQAPGSGSAAQSSAGAGGAGATGTETVAGGAASTSSSNEPAQQSTNAAGRVSQSLFGLAVTALAAFLVL